MAPADRPEFVEALAGLFAAYGKTPGEDQADAYWRYLRDLPMADVLDGLEGAGRTGGRFVPSVGQIREAIAGLRGTTRDTRTHRVMCDDCEGIGWLPTTVMHISGYPVSAVMPCHCAAGEAKRTARARRAA